MNRTVTGIALFLAGSTLAIAQGTGGGFTGPDTTRAVTAVEAATLADDTVVKLTGYIVKSLGDERYEFKDDAGTVTVEIDGEDWRGVEAKPDTRVELRGEVDKEWNRVEIDVDTVALAP